MRGSALARICDTWSGREGLHRLAPRRALHLDPARHLLELPLRDREAEDALQDPGVAANRGGLDARLLAVACGSCRCPQMSGDRHAGHRECAAVAQSATQS
jgi:hypothetical protein